MANIFKTIKGIMGSLFQIGGPSGNQIKNQSDGLAIRNAADSAHQNMSIKQASGSVPAHAVNWQDLRDQSPLMQFSFDGATAPSGGSNTGTYGFCHTSGGSYTAGQVYYDSGTALVAIKTFIGMTITTGSAITGTVSLSANGLYVAHSAAAPYTWTLKGDGIPQSIGYPHVIELALDTAASKSSSTSIPAGSKIMSVSTNITSAYDNSAGIQIVVDGVVSELTIQATNENDPATVGIYDSEPVDMTVDSDTEGHVKLIISNTPSTGAGTVLVTYLTDALS
ncbi:MAG: hypothetical protein KKD63_16850 [Proteobacteria bacterium]|nr:hypothetical protein [Desulfobulbaceae bacterium]MBU4154541.1 hypothetical protein [Pseudomonadota bacterium]